MNAKPMTYEHVPLGFEIVINNTDVEMGKIWNLWHNVKLTDDPESWDPEIRLINEMQGRLDKLTVDQRLIPLKWRSSAGNVPFSQEASTSSAAR